ncbi:cyclin-I isoform X1 [Vulpes vulpes]|uniref:Cyclin-I isoform X1 n=1 Tax=Vulpes vulpes TaxID=9627 RepID=A0ABM4ZG67_VULVU|nr:cyclin-I isoform X1 [Canis lupus familiaris]XP_022269356.1 cyclin-I isoform X1 [Canis lupus familiaris]XP_022269357.1 cyclin-I isoform X1 [Canis lupus familiaris]XP_035565427.1 cyclin-I isoform X1 [Canis lupus dingo]XP_035565428.1 cyclin-I isoform X1 [Canis lupus dingo]XP_035565429.1 cyclin-I isoform X1 [Canis lupus dingo]XP_038299824.1 cyclin-I isoform X1 [Canis lupus familiaris]XP_038299825.1 cyclin-I isoform X1 [Canis lupus familiaris]XP_038438304.1 cyclin-I isoform X1 [Canis lupus fa|eukprot:XP_022269355.1 cyclin-I isoform X1 [Canis lupus familiaris]
MKFPGPLENQRLSFLLEKAISREAQMWKVNVPKMPTNQSWSFPALLQNLLFCSPSWSSGGGACCADSQNVSPSQRDEVIQWLAKLKYQFNLYPETFALASSLLDRFLATVKAHPKYLSCIAISCFFLAAKTVEEDERIPVLKVLARDSFCGCSSSEILRMERIILDKLNWDLHTATPLDFLHIFHAIAVSTRPQLLFSLPKLSPSQHLAVLTKQLLHCMACNQLLQFKGSMLALAIVSLEMEKLIPDWLPLTIELLQKAQMDSSQLIHCRELVAHHLSSLQSSLPLNSVYVYRPLKHTLVTCDKGVFRLHPSSVPGPDLDFSKDNSKPEVPVRGAAAFYHHLPAASGCKHTSAKRKVEEMEVDDFYDGIKRLYNEDNASENVGSVCGTDLSRQEGHASPCPPLQPVSVM